MKAQEPMTTEEEEVLDANRKFYRALQNLSLEEMEDVWLQDDWVRCVHPGWDMVEGWEAVRESWEQIFANTQFMRVVVGLQFVRVEDSTAWVCCTEKTSSAAEGRFDTAYVQSTNIFQRLEGGWFLVHHHASHIPRRRGPTSDAEVVQ